VYAVRKMLTVNMVLYQGVFVCVFMCKLHLSFSSILSFFLVCFSTILSFSSFISLFLLSLFFSHSFSSSFVFHPFYFLIFCFVFSQQFSLSSSFYFSAILPFFFVLFPGHFSTILSSFLLPFSGIVSSSLPLLRSDSLFLPTSLSQPISLSSFLPLSPIHSIFFYFLTFSFLLN